MLDINTKKGLDAFKKSMNESIDRRIRKIEENEAFEKLKTLPLHRLNAIFESTTPELFKNADGLRLIAKYAYAINENKSVRKRYRAYAMLSEKCGKDITNSYLTEMAEIVGNGGEDYPMGIKKVASVVKECIKKSGMNPVEAVEEKSALCESFDAFDALADGKKTLSEVDKRVSNIEIIKEQISKAEGKQEHTDSENSDIKASELTEGLEKWEADVVNDVMLSGLSGGLKEDIYEKYKQKAIDALNEAIESTEDKAEISRLNEMLQKVSERKFCKESAYEDTLKMSELSTII